MKPTLVLLAFLLLPAASFAKDQVLIVADEFPAMEMLADKLNIVEKIPATMVSQTAMPSDLSPFPAVIVYIHMRLTDAAEQAFIDYTRAGGKLIVLHHSISSGKRRNKRWLHFLHVSLPEGDARHGGYLWIEGVNQTIVNLAPDHFITTNRVTYPDQVTFQTADEPAGKKRPCFTLKETEVYLNHLLDGPRTPLLGVKYTDKASGRTYMQADAGWLKSSGKGWIIYLQPGDTVRDIENPVFAQILLNAILWKP